MQTICTTTDFSLTIRLLVVTRHCRTHVKTQDFDWSKKVSRPSYAHHRRPTMIGKRARDPSTKSIRQMWVSAKSSYRRNFWLTVIITKTQTRSCQRVDRDGITRKWGSVNWLWRARSTTYYVHTLTRDERRINNQSIIDISDPLSLQWRYHLRHRRLRE